MRITFKPRFFGRAARFFFNLTNDLDESDFYLDMVPHISMRLKQVFNTEGFGSWEQLSDPYASWKSEHYPGQMILRLTDEYYKAATEVGHPNNLLQVAKNQLEFGVEGLDYAPLHEEGTDVMPARPVFRLLADSNEFNNELVDVFDEWLRLRVQQFLGSPSG